MTQAPQPGGTRRPPSLRRMMGAARTLPPMRHPNAYVWFVFFSTMDVMLTWRILRGGGRELNPVARHVLEYWSALGEDWDIWVALSFKFCMMLLVIISCEVVGRKRPRVALWLAGGAVGITACAVVYALSLLVYQTYAVHWPGA